MSLQGVRVTQTSPVALVTGGARGIGAAAVAQLRAQRLRVLFTYVPGFDGTPADDDAHPLDLRDPAGISTLFDAIVARHGGLDVLVNNAAVGSATVAGFSPDPAQQDALMMQINAVGTLSMCRGFLALRGTGHPGPRKIINIASVGGGIAAFPGFALSDGMSKSAVAHLTRQLAAELTGPEVDVFALCPGATNTAMFRASTLDPMSPEKRAGFLAALPKGRLIEPVEIATLIGFLAGPHSTVLHGAVIDASMGLGVRPGLVTEAPH
mgnify:FL=1